MRVANRLMAALLALGLVLAGLLVSIESVSGLTGNGAAVVGWEGWRTDLQARPWSDATVRFVATGTVIVGLLVLAAGISARDRRLRLRSENPDVVLSTTAQALARSLRHRGEAVPGVASLNVRVGRRRAVVRAVAPMQDPRAIHDSLHRELGGALAALPWQRQPQLRIQVRGTERRSR